MTMQSTSVDNVTIGAAVAMSAVSLFLSGWAFIASLDDGDFERDTERRIACLELPGANDCGADGR